MGESKGKSVLNVSAIYLHTLPTYYLRTYVHTSFMYTYCHTADTPLYRMMIHVIKVMVSTMIILLVMMRIREMM